MKKKYPIIKVGDYLYAVDRAFKVGDYFVAQSEKEHEVGLIKSYYIESRLLNRSWNTNWYAPESSFGVFHIVATNNPSLKGVLKLPPIEEPLGVLALKDLGNIDIDEGGFDRGLYLGWQKGYKAAQAKGKYSEEDMRNAIDMARAGNTRVYILNHFKSLSKVPKYSEEDIRGAFDAGITALLKKEKDIQRQFYEKGKAKVDTKEEFQNYLKSLSKVPNAIEVEMLEWETPSKTKDGQYDKVWLPKSNNNIIVGRYIYE